MLCSSVIRTSTLRTTTLDVHYLSVRFNLPKHLPSYALAIDVATFTSVTTWSKYLNNHLTIEKDALCVDSDSTQAYCESLCRVRSASTIHFTTFISSCSQKTPAHKMTMSNVHIHYSYQKVERSCRHLFKDKTRVGTWVSP